MKDWKFTCGYRQTDIERRQVILSMHKRKEGKKERRHEIQTMQKNNSCTSNEGQTKYSKIYLLLVLTQRSGRGNTSTPSVSPRSCRPALGTWFWPSSAPSGRISPPRCSWRPSPRTPSLLEATCGNEITSRSLLFMVIVVALFCCCFFCVIGGVGLLKCCVDWCLFFLFSYLPGRYGYNRLSLYLSIALRIQRDRNESNCIYLVYSMFLLYSCWQIMNTWWHKNYDVYREFS